jgi:hypothetical protein
VPSGGSDVTQKNKTKDDVRKALAQLPFEERRVLIDQGHKLTSAISEIVARDGRAIAAIWRHHHVTYPRPEHLARDGDVFLIRDSWAYEQGLVKPSGRKFTDDVESPGQLPLCRCTFTYRYHLRDLPPDMLTVAGRAALDEARARRASA